ncbi:MAG: ribonuclease HII [Beijerinckiaceae bacterium]|nr:ribonuclease HII [Beijerinckiaceae bacterium]
MTCTYDMEADCLRSGLGVVAGVDEAGRGPLAGPVTVAAVILDQRNIPQGLNDSKKLTEAKREALFEAILATSHVSIVSVPPREIDRINILQATLRAMRFAVAGLPLRTDLALFDGRDVPKGLGCAGRAVIGGDALVLSIAAASIMAKVTRDRMMRRAHHLYPAYGFASHKGYGTAEHLFAIEKHGATPLHRLSFAPLRLADCA